MIKKNSCGRKSKEEKQNLDKYVNAAKKYENIEWNQQKETKAEKNPTEPITGKTWKQDRKQKEHKRKETKIKS